MMSAQELEDGDARAAEGRWTTVQLRCWSSGLLELSHSLTSVYESRVERSDLGGAAAAWLLRGSLAS